MKSVMKEQIERVLKMVEDAMTHSRHQEIIQHRPVSRAIGHNGTERIVRGRDYTITIKCYDYDPDGKNATDRIWKTVPDDDVQNIWACDNEDCPRCGTIVSVHPDYYQCSGNPLCDQCDEELVYQCTEVVYPWK